MTSMVFSAIVYLVIAGYITFLNFGEFVKIINDARAIFVVIIYIFIFWLILGGFAGILYDCMSERENHDKIHKKFFLFGLLSFFREVRHNYICDKCF